MVGVAAALVGGFFAFNTYIYEEKQAAAADTHMNAEYVIEGNRVKLENGVNEMASAPGSASKTITRYFGNELRTDLNGDGREDIVFPFDPRTRGVGHFLLRCRRP